MLVNVNALNSINLWNLINCYLYIFLSCAQRVGKELAYTLFSTTYFVFKLETTEKLQNSDPRFLSAPCRSTDSQKLFSAASHVKRS